MMPNKLPGAIYHTSPVRVRLKDETNNKLNVYRQLSEGGRVLAGQLAQNSQATFFQYDADYLAHYHSLSPFKLPFNSDLCQAPEHPHQGLHGVFADSLPDGWGLLLMNRVFRQHGIHPQQLTAMDRLAYIGARGMGALTYAPVSEHAEPDQNALIDIAVLAESAIQMFDGQTEEVLAALANAGGSGGARPKALIFMDPQNPQCVATIPRPGFQPWLIKFTSQNLLLGHEEGRCEAAYLTMAHNAGIQVPDWQLIEASGSKAWLATRRFDCSPNHHYAGRYHVQSLCGLLDADFRQPSIDYEDLIKASQILCQSPAIGKVQFVRAMFNLFAANQDDHSKNWSFLMADDGQWQPAPFYDATFSPNANNEHTTAFVGYGKQPPLRAVQQLANQANFSSWNEAQEYITRIVDAISQWSIIATELGVCQRTRTLINAQLNAAWQQNKHLIAGYSSRH
ncbi:Toxin HigB / Protein kinase domain of HipA [hydrothermal vent metagenome]|uniref:Toxin HigB / Protein kinase domain of HipA n=1 Tax=hydrothermal vent metagenome TaxID=652676 RepID=A0A3B1AXZ7_9ZZZZ